MNTCTNPPGIAFTCLSDDFQLKMVQRLIDKALSEPYSLYTYRYFAYNWPQLCLMARHGEHYVGAVLCKLESFGRFKQGYIAMLAVDADYRKQRIGTALVERAIDAMRAEGATDIMLDTELSNKAALNLYESLGFLRMKLLLRYYINGGDAVRLRLGLKN